MRDVIMIVITPAALVAGAVAGTIRNRLDWRSGVGLRLPSLRDALIYGAVFAVLMAAFELLYSRDGGGGAADWRTRYSGAALWMRVVFAAAIYPIAEELFFRGFLLALITRKAGIVIAVLATAAGFTAMHSLGNSWIGVAQIFTDGAFFAIARWRTGSLYLPMAFHVIGNSMAVGQRLL